MQLIKTNKTMVSAKDIPRKKLPQRLYVILNFLRVTFFNLDNNYQIFIKFIIHS